MTRLPTVDKAAEKIGVTPRQVRHWIDIGELAFVPCGRRIFVTEEDFEAMIDRLKTRKKVEEDGEEIELE